MQLTCEMSGRRATPREQKDLEETARLSLGRLARHVSHAAIAVRDESQFNGRVVHQCTLRLRVPRDSDIVIESLRPHQGAAIAGAFREARRELIRRRRVRALTTFNHTVPCAA